MKTKINEKDTIELLKVKIALMSEMALVMKNLADKLQKEIEEGEDKLLTLNTLGSLQIASRGLMKIHEKKKTTTNKKTNNK